MDQEQIVDAVRDWLDGDDWHYDYNAEKHMISAGIKLDCKMRSARVYIPIRDDNSYIVNIVAPIKGDPNDLDELIKYLTMANYGLANGNFELDVRDGEIRYKTYVNCRELESLPDRIIKDGILVGWYMMERYGDGIAAISMGFSDAETEIKKAEGDSDDESD